MGTFAPLDCRSRLHYRRRDRFRRQAVKPFVPLVVGSFVLSGCDAVTRLSCKDHLLCGVAAFFAQPVVKPPASLICKDTRANSSRKPIVPSNREHAPRRQVVKARALLVVGTAAPLGYETCYAAEFREPHALRGH